MFREAIEAGAAAGADLVLIETMSDAYELKAAVLAAKEGASLPVCATVTLDRRGKLLTGGDVASVVALLEGLRVDALGLNCGLGPVSYTHLKSVTKINRTEYNNVYENKGIDSIVSPKLLTANEIVRYVRAMDDTTGSSAVTLYRIVDGKAEALEFSVKHETPYTGIPLHQLRLNPDILIASIIRARKVIIPSGNDEIRKGDSIIIVTTADHTIACLLYTSRCV